MVPWQIRSPRIWWHLDLSPKARRRKREREQHRAEWEAKMAALPKFDHAPPGFPVEVFTRGGSVTWDPTQAPCGTYTFRTPVNCGTPCEPIKITVTRVSA